MYLHLGPSIDDADRTGSCGRRVQLDIVHLLLWIPDLELAQFIPDGATATRQVSQCLCVCLGRRVDVPCSHKELWGPDGHEVLPGKSLPCHTQMV